MKIKPIKDRVILNYIPSQEKVNDKGIIITTTETEEDYLDLEVLAVGVDCKYVEVGDTVKIRKEELFQFHDGTKFTFFTVEKLILMKKISEEVLQPLYKRVLVEVEKMEEVTSGGIILPDTIIYDEKNQKKGKIVAIGDEVKYVKVGDRVLINRSMCLQLPNKLLSLAEDDVFAIITED